MNLILFILFDRKYQDLICFGIMVSEKATGKHGYSILKIKP